jgi:uncharacterized protein (DUF2249 family)
MTPEIDLRERPSAEHRTELFEALDGAEPGDEFDVVADRDVDPELVRYQVERNRALTWDHAHPDAEPREVSVTVGESVDDEARATIDVRDLKPQRHHQALLQIFDELAAEEGFVLVNDHDPKPLYHELRSMHGDVVDWEYANRGDGEWRVAVGKTDESDADDADVVTRYDVRDIPKPERHPTIHHRYGMIPEGGTMELVAPHEPKPLHREFQQRYGDAFTWDVVESEPGRCRVRVMKAKETDGEGESTEPAESTDVAAAPADDETVEVGEELDVRDLPPAQRHELIYDAYDDLDAGTGFVLVNDHDPKPLYHQFEAEAGPEFRWEYRQQAAGEFRVLIGKADAPVDDEHDAQTEAPF